MCLCCLCFAGKAFSGIKLYPDMVVSNVCEEPWYPGLQNDKPKMLDKIRKSRGGEGMTLTLHGGL